MIHRCVTELANIESHEETDVNMGPHLRFLRTGFEGKASVTSDLKMPRTCRVLIVESLVAERGSLIRVLESPPLYASATARSFLRIPSKWRWMRSTASALSLAATAS